MSSYQYRILLSAVLLIEAFSAATLFISPDIMPAGCQNEMIDTINQSSPGNVLAIATLGIVSVALQIIGLCGLFFWRSWAPVLSMIGMVTSFLWWPLAGNDSLSGFKLSIHLLESSLLGAAIFMAFFKPLSDKFKNVVHDGSDKS